VANFVRRPSIFQLRAAISRTGGMIAAVGSVLLTPWNLFSPGIDSLYLDVLGPYRSAVRYPGGDFT
jgi:cytosine/uracil/thiamine/allantoin permease